MKLVLKFLKNGGILFLVSLIMAFVAGIYGFAHLTDPINWWFIGGSIIFGIMGAISIIGLSESTEENNIVKSQDVLLCCIFALFASSLFIESLTFVLVVNFIGGFYPALSLIFALLGKLTSS